MSRGPHRVAHIRCIVGGHPIERGDERYRVSYLPEDSPPQNGRVVATICGYHGRATLKALDPKATTHEVVQ